MRVGGEGERVWGDGRCALIGTPVLCIAKGGI